MKIWSTEEEPPVAGYENYYPKNKKEIPKRNHKETKNGILYVKCFSDLF
jgi:hypothetical protein